MAAGASAIPGYGAQYGRFVGTTNVLAGASGAPLSGASLSAMSGRASGFNYPGTMPLFMPNQTVPGTPSEFGAGMGLMNPAVPTIDTSGNSAAQTIAVRHNQRQLKVNDVVLPLLRDRELAFLLTGVTPQDKMTIVTPTVNLQRDLRKVLDAMGPRLKGAGPNGGLMSSLERELMANVRDGEMATLQSPVGINYLLFCQHLEDVKKAAALVPNGLDAYAKSLYGERTIQHVLDGLKFDGVVYNAWPTDRNASDANTRAILTLQAAGSHIMMVDYWQGKADSGKHLYVRIRRREFDLGKLPSFSFAGDAQEKFASGEYKPGPAPNVGGLPDGKVYPPVVEFVALDSRADAAKYCAYKTFGGQAHYDGHMLYVGKVLHVLPSATKGQRTYVDRTTPAPDDVPYLTNRYALFNDQPPLLVILQPTR